MSIDLCILDDFCLVFSNWGGGLSTSRATQCIQILSVKQLLVIESLTKTLLSFAGSIAFDIDTTPATATRLSHSALTGILLGPVWRYCGYYVNVNIYIYRHDTSID